MTGRFDVIPEDTMPAPAAKPAKWGGIHAATMKSKRLQAVYLLLHERGEAGATSAEMTQRFKACAIGTTVSELRHAIRDKGYGISCQFVKRENGCPVYRYRLQPIEP